MELFYHEEYEKSFTKFALLVDLKTKILYNSDKNNDNIVILKSLAIESFGKCYSNSMNELSCLVTSNTYFNMGIALLHFAAYSVQDTEIQLDYIEVAHDSFVLAKEYIASSGLGDRSSHDYNKQLHGMIHFLSFLLKSLSFTRHNTNSNNNNNNNNNNIINSITNQCAKVTMQISFVSEVNVNTEGDSSNSDTTSVQSQEPTYTTNVETHHAEVCTCDNLAESSHLFCQTLSISNCEVTYDRFLDAINKQIFDGILYDIYSILHNNNNINEINESLDRSGNYKGWTPLPKLFHSFLVISEMRGVCAR